MHKLLENFKVYKSIPKENYAEFTEFILEKMKLLNAEDEDIYLEIIIYLLILYKKIDQEKIFNVLELRLQKNEKKFLNTSIIISSYLNNKIEEKNFNLLHKYKNLFVHDKDFYAKLSLNNASIKFSFKKIINYEKKIFPVNSFNLKFLQEILQKIEKLSNLPFNKKNKLILKNLYDALFLKACEKKLSAKKYLRRLVNILFLNSEFFYLSQFKILSLFLEYDFKQTMQILNKEIKSREQYVHSKLVMYFGVLNYKNTFHINLEEIEKFMQLCETFSELKNYLI